MHLGAAAASAAPFALQAATLRSSDLRPEVSRPSRVFLLNFQFQIASSSPPRDRHPDRSPARPFLPARSAGAGRSGGTSLLLFAAVTVCHPERSRALCFSFREAKGARRREGSAFASSISARKRPLLPPYKIFTALAASSARIDSEISACSIIPAFAHRDSTAVSVGENAVLVLNARKR